MAEHTAISWATHTFNPWIGCTKVSPACDHCYAERQQDIRHHRVKWGAGKPRSRTSDANWRLPHRWNRAAPAFREKHGHWPRVFCASLADVFDNEVPRVWRRELFLTIAATPDLRWILLTKRIGNAEDMIAEATDGFEEAAELDDTSTRWRSAMWRSLFAHVGIMATVVNQEEAERDIPKLLALKQSLGVTWVGISIEPMLGTIRFRPYTLTERPCPVCQSQDALREPREQASHPINCGWRHDLERAGGSYQIESNGSGIDWVIAGGESGPGARASHPDWFRALRDQCAAAHVPFHFKQWGEWIDADNWLDDIQRGPGEILKDGKAWKPQRPLNFEDAEQLARICNRTCIEHHSSGQTMIKVGKQAAGRVLDGIEHNAFPEALT